MARVMTFSRHFPAYHPRAGQPTHFVEKILASLPKDQLAAAAYQYGKACSKYIRDNPDLLLSQMDKVYPKMTTFRVGKHWKVGDKFSPRIWSGRPRNSKQIIICDDLEIKEVNDVRIDQNGLLHIDSFTFSPKSSYYNSIARHDGFEVSTDFFNWFAPNLPFEGQFIIWV